MSFRILGAAILAASLVPALWVTASSHSDAPRIKQDPQANLTDVYAFLGRRYDDPSQIVLNVAANVRPFSEPGDGPHYDRFAADARYSLHITHPETGETLVRYDFMFSAPDAAPKNPDTILSYGRGTTVGPIATIGDSNQNFTQTYSVTKVVAKIDEDDEDDKKFRDADEEEYDDVRVIRIGESLPVAPPNPGSNVTPFYNDAEGKAKSGAKTFSELDTYTQQAISDLATGEVVFAGSRDDSFYADIPGVFDLLNARILYNDGNGVDGFKGFNVLSFMIQIPIEDLPSLSYESVFFGEQTGVGVYASVSRPRLRKLGNDGRVKFKGPWVQINRLANPVFNEALVALRDKDNYNVASPTADAQFAKYARSSELAFLINATFDTEFQVENRVDLENIYIPDVLRVNTTTGAVPLFGQENFNRLGFIGGDTTMGVSSAWPNGRRFGDDVIDIALTAIASGPSYATINLLGDNVNGNDLPFQQVFPYAATPHSGTFNRKDPVPAPPMEGDLNGDGKVDVQDLLRLLGAW